MQSNPKAESDGLLAFFALACGITWLLAVPAARAWTQHAAPSPGAIACAGLSAFGPLGAAALVAGRRRCLGAVFGRWRTGAAWIAWSVLALFSPMIVHVVATAVFAALGGRPVQWLHPPATPEQIAALVVFPIGEEFGWRGFAHPRVVARWGAVRGSLVLGLVWGLWHLAYSITPAAAGFDGFVFAMTMIELPLYSLLIAWVFERANRSIAVALAFHFGAHLDHLELAPQSELGLHAAHLGLVAVLATIAARSLAKRVIPGT